MMARKGRVPLAEVPPPAVSSSEEEDSSEEEQEEQQNQSSSTEEENPPSIPPPPSYPSSIKKAPTQKKPDPPKPAEYESDSDSPIVKHMKAKPSKATVTAASKRPASEIEKGSAKKARREKVEPSGGGGSAQDEGKKELFQRLWSEDDEIVILKGMIEYKAKKGTDPLADADDFLDFIKKSLHVVDVKRDQIVSKIRRLKKKFQNATKKKITNPHELNAFELSKKIWGSDGGVKNYGLHEDDNDNSSLISANNAKSRVSHLNSKGSRGVNGLAFEDRKNKDVSNKGKDAGNLGMARCKRVIQFGEVGEIGFLNEGFMKEGLKLLGEEKRAELEQKWWTLNVAEMEMLLRRLELYQEMTQRALNALKSAGH